MLSVIADETARAKLHTDLDELAREGARRMLAAALEAEVDAYLAAAAAERDAHGPCCICAEGVTDEYLSGGCFHSKGDEDGPRRPIVNAL